jgi:toxin-antitoxin system PIN domain toxin
VTTWLLDGNVLVALGIETHAHTERVHRWFTGLESGDRFATCPTTQGTLLRVHMMSATDGSARAAWEALERLSLNPRHVLWREDLSYLDVPYRGIQGHRQVTDAYLAELARRNGGRLATLDAGLAALHPDVATLVR